jgi:predicted RNA-binding protein (virulence factor B family)
LSKKAFKRAVGSLLKQGKISIDAAGFVVVLPRNADVEPD